MQIFLPSAAKEKKIRTNLTHQNIKWKQLIQRKSSTLKIKKISQPVNVRQNASRANKTTSDNLYR